MKKLKEKALLATVFLLLGIIISLGSGSTTTQQFEAHDPIEIIGNSEFNEYAQNESWVGDGSQGTPYLIQGLAFTDLSIKHTDCFFEVKDNQVTNAEEFGISFYNVSHGTISGNTIDKCSTGAILIDTSANNSITNNIISQNDITGIRILKSHNNTITGNTISNNGGIHVGARVCGIFMEFSHENVLTNNIINKNANIGLNLPFSNLNLISGNTISNHLYSGIDMINGLGNSWYYKWGSDNVITENELYQNDWGIGIRGASNVISRNKIYMNTIGIYVGLYQFVTDVLALTDDSVTSLATNTEIVSNEIYNNSLGLFLDKSNDISIMTNSFYTNTGYGLSIKSSSSTTDIKQNDFIANNLDGISQASDNGSSTTFLNNYWYEWTSPDSDSDSIVDEPYAVDGSTSNTDPSPLTAAYNSNSPTGIAPPEPKASSGWTFSFLLLTIISLVIIRKRK